MSDHDCVAVPLGGSFDNPRLVNLVAPAKSLEINGMVVDMELFAKAAEKLGAGKYDILSINGFRNAYGELVPDYDSVKIEKRK